MSQTISPFLPEQATEPKLYPTILRPEHIRAGNFIHYSHNTHDCPALIMETLHDHAFAKMSVLLLDSMQVIKIHLGLGPGVPQGFTRSLERSNCRATSREKAIAYINAIITGPHDHTDDTQKEALKKYKTEAESYGLL